MRLLLGVTLTAALAGCKGIEGPWTGTCETSIGDLVILTRDLAPSPVPENLTGPLEVYTAAAEATFPAGDVFPVDLTFAHCIEESTCSDGFDDWADGEVAVFMVDVSGTDLITGFGPLKGNKSIEGTCDTGFGSGAFVFERTNKGLGE